VFSVAWKSSGAVLSVHRYWRLYGGGMPLMTMGDGYACIMLAGTVQAACGGPSVAFHCLAATTLRLLSLVLLFAVSLLQLAHMHAIFVAASLVCHDCMSAMQPH
jgi:hypothetical protein